MNEPGLEKSTPDYPAQAEGESSPLVLVVDDHPMVLQTVEFLLKTKGFRTLIAPDGETAVALCGRHLGEVSVVITDMMMPGMDGSSTICALRALDPHLVFIVMSGSIDDGFIAQLDDLGVVAFLQKPFSVDEMMQALHKALDHPCPPQAS